MDDLYTELSNVHGGERSLNCTRADQEVWLNGTHDGTFGVNADYRDTNAMRITDPADPDALYPLKQQDYFVLERYYHNMPRSTPECWAWRRQSIGGATARGTLAVGDVIEIFPKPDRLLKLVHSYWTWAGHPGSSGWDVVMNSWGKMLRAYLAWQCFESLGEHVDAQPHREEFLRQKEMFRDWDDELYADTPLEFQNLTRSGIMDLPIME